MNPFFFEAMKLFDEIRVSIVTYINRYFAGNSTTGAQSSLQDYIGSQAGISSNVIKTGLTDLVKMNDQQGSPSIVDIIGTTCTILANTPLYSVEIIGNSTTKPTATIGGEALPLEYDEWTIGSTSIWRGRCDLNCSFSTTTTMTGTNVGTMSITFEQDQSTGTECIQ